MVEDIEYILEYNASPSAWKKIFRTNSKLTLTKIIPQL